MRACLSSRAFTLVELLVVIAIVGLLSTIVLAVTSGVSEQGRIAKSLQFSKHLENSLGDHLVGRWTFDETANLCGASRVCDTSGWDNHGTMHNFVLPCGLVDDDTPSGQGGAMRFDGEDDYVSILNNNLDEGDASVELWVKFNNSENNTIIDTMIYSGAGTSGDRGFWIGRGSENTFKFYFSGGVGRTTQTVALDNGLSNTKWHHVVVIFNRDDTGLIYIDGVKQGNTVDISSYTGSISHHMQLGAKVTPTETYQMEGILDEVRIYNIALTAFQIQSQYYVGLNKLLTKRLINKEEYQTKLSLINQ